MNAKMKLRKYVPPQAGDLSGANAIGQGPMGGCTGGNYPDYYCATGDRYMASCGGGSTVDTSACNPGLFVSYNRCVYGSDAAMQCKAGTHN